MRAVGFELEGPDGATTRTRGKTRPTTEGSHREFLRRVAGDGGDGGAG